MVAGHRMDSESLYPATVSALPEAASPSVKLNSRICGEQRFKRRSAFSRALYVCNGPCLSTRTTLHYINVNITFMCSVPCTVRNVVHICTINKCTYKKSI